MRCTSALVLATLAVGQAAALDIRHANFHARRHAEAKRDLKDVNWATVAYDLSHVDWSSVFAKPAATPSPSAAVVQAQAVTSAPAAVSAAPTVEAAKPAATQASNAVQGVKNDITNGLESFAKKIGVKLGVNSQTANGNIWLGDDSPWKVDFINDAASDLKLFCWAASGFSGMSLNVNPPAISINLAKGAKQTVSFADGVPAACAPAFDNTVMALFGGIKNTWFEATFGKDGAFDVSRNVNMNGNNISAKGSKCTSDMSTCVFQCADKSASSCETGYELLNCGAGSGGGGGFDVKMQGVGGGCAMGASSEKVTVTFT